MSTVTLYRGISVPAVDAEQTIHAIETVGILGTERNPNAPISHNAWMYNPHEVRGRIDALFSNPDLTIEDLGQPGWSRATFACGTEFGAKYYACCHNYERGNYSIVVKFTAPIHQIYVDNRDFLASALWLLDDETANGNRRKVDILTRVFGPAIERYCSATTRRRESFEYLAALSLLASIDQDVVRAHLANTEVISGRYRTRFRSAFFVKAPIPPERIVRISEAQFLDEDRKRMKMPDVSLSEDFKDV